MQIRTYRSRPLFALYRAAVRPVRNCFGTVVIGCLLCFAAGAASAVEPCTGVTSDAAGNNARPYLIDVPENVAGGEDFEARVLIRNCGTSSWLDAAGSTQPFTLALDFAGTAGLPWGAPYRFAIPRSPVAGDEFVTFVIPLTAPEAVGDYTLQFQMNQLGVGFFGELTEERTIHVACPKLSLGTDNNAEIVSLSVPAEVEINGQFEAQLTVRNTGTSCWNDNDSVRRYAVGDDTTGNTWTPGRHFLDSSLLPVLPQEELTISFVVDAPSSPEIDEPFRVRMIQTRADPQDTAYGWFGDLSVTAEIDVVSAPTRDARFVDLDVPPVIVLGQTYPVRVTMQNTGSATWTAADNFLLGLLGLSPNDNWGEPSRQPVPHDVLPNQFVTFEFDLVPGAGLGAGVPPSTPLEWQMIEQGGVAWFGETTSPAKQPEVRDMSNRITVSGDSFLDGTADYVVRGFNYLPFYDYFALDGARTSAQQNVWRTYDPAIIESEMRDIAGLGANTVRFWAPFLSQIWQAGDGEPAICQDLRHTLDEAHRNGLRVVLSFEINRDAIIGSGICQGTVCVDDPIGKVSTLFYFDEARSVVIDNNLDILESCGLLDSSRPPLFAVEFWQEPATGNSIDRRGFKASKAWHEHVVEKYCDKENTDCTCDPELASCDNLATLAEAFSQWNHTGEVLCGPDKPSQSSTTNAYLCAPNDNELCTDNLPENSAAMAIAYREFVDSKASEAYKEAVTALRSREDDVGLGDHQETMVTLGFASLFARDEAEQELRCMSGRGYFLNPRLGIGIFDYASIHLYPWSDIGVPFEDAVANSALDDKEPEKRYHQLRFLLDYIRAGRPVVLEETGYNTCNGSPIETADFQGCAVSEPSGNEAGCVLRDDVQKEVWEKEADNIAQIQANGALYWVYRDRADRAHWGAVRLDETVKPVYGDIPQLMETLRSGRDLPPMAFDCVEVNPYLQPNWNASLMASYGDYLVAADDDAGGYEHVEVCVGVGCCTAN